MYFNNKTSKSLSNDNYKEERKSTIIVGHFNTNTLFSVIIEQVDKKTSVGI